MYKVYLVSSFLLGLLVLSQAQANDNKIGFYELKKGNFRLNLTNYGATVVSVIVPDKHGVFYVLNYLYVGFMFPL